MNKSNLALKLWHKGLIVVLIPLAMGLLFIGILWVELGIAERDARQAHHVKEVISAIDDTSVSLMESGRLLALYSLTRSPLIRSRIEHIITNGPSRMQRLADLVSADAQQLQCAHKIEQLQKRIIQWLQMVMAVADASPANKQDLDSTIYSLDENFTIKGMRRDLSAIFAQLFAELSDLRKSVESKSVIRADSEWRDTLRKLLVLGVLCECAISISMAVYFSKSITGRVKVIIDNARRFAVRSSLNPILGGSDELSLLDREFHDMVQKIAEVEKLKKEFLAMISHDLRTPLSTIMINLDIIAEYSDANEPVRVRASKSARESRRVLDLVNDMLDLEKMESGTFHLQIERLDVEELLRNAVDAVAPRAEQKNVQLNYPDEINFDIVADGNRVLQILNNLLGNAIKYSPDGGAIIIDCQPRQQMLEFSIADEGPGVPKEKQKLIFEPYMQVEAADQLEKKGSGLGLAICKALVEQHGGEIGLRPAKDGKGTVFWFTLPLAAVS